ncbi:hypothetical protein Acr_00g0047450 [Actinidia rufa]|uniref:Uncharacterized protein n=1 Tax=Actinidia rufa TaxID=165716 RepID=A0A7J0DLL3_9ERIC|nr:hypothetical protein Acr_00g0047450 [Actinidia rufa]
MSTMKTGSSSKKSKSKGKENADYDSSRFTGKVEEKLYNNLTMFKAELILTLCQEFMANIKYNPVTEKGKERLTSLVWGKKLKVTPDTFTKVFGIPQEENPEFELLDVGMPDLATISHELSWKGKSGMGRDPVRFTGVLTKLFKRSGVHIPVDLIRIEPERPIYRSSLSRSKGQRKKRRLEAIAHEKPSIGIAELKEEITNLRMETNSRMTALEKESSRHTTMLQEIKGMLI